MSNFGTDPAPDPTPYGERPEIIKRCCVGKLEITASLKVIAKLDGTAILYAGTIMVDATTQCLIDMPCEGRSNALGGILKGESCAEFVSSSDEDLSDAIDRTVGVAFPSIWNVKLIRYTKFGCCEAGCADKHKSNTYVASGGDDFGTVPIGDFPNDIKDQILANYGFGGSIADPEFHKCC